MPLLAAGQAGWRRRFRSIRRWALEPGQIEWRIAAAHRPMVCCQSLDQARMRHTPLRKQLIQCLAEVIRGNAMLFGMPGKQPIRKGHEIREG